MTVNETETPATPLQNVVDALKAQREEAVKALEGRDHLDLTHFGDSLDEADQTAKVLDWEMAHVKTTSDLMNLGVRIAQLAHHISAVQMEIKMLEQIAKF